MSATVFRREHGQAAVEFAFALVIVLFLIAGFFDLGRGVWHYNGLSQAVRTGARYGIVHGSNSGAAVGIASCGATLENLVKGRVAGLLPGDISVTCTWPDGDNNPGIEVKVEASATWVPIMGSFMPGGAGITLSARSRMIIVY